jgi:Tol biopolymer transport system component
VSCRCLVEVRPRVAFWWNRDTFDGSGQTQLTSNSDSAPSWSPDGLMIAFQSFRDGDYDIYVMNADGSGQRAVTNNTVDDEDPAWSPDGQKIAFESYRPRGGQAQIFVINADGSKETRLTNTKTGGNEFSDWQPL